MERTPEQQEREINDLLRKSLRASDDSALKRDVLNRLIDLAHSPYSRLKAIASNHLPKYIKACPELEDDGINAVYDLCEDPDREIRIAGYEAIARVSDEEPKFIKRNADVLVQLLQSDEPTEVKVVKKALVRHLEGNAPVTLNVLCDQIAPQDEAMDAEEQATRDNLLSLVVAFIGGDAKKAVTRHAGIAESVLAAGLLVAIPKLNAKEVDIVGRDILMLFPSYQSGSSRNGQVLLQAVLDRAQPILTEELRSTDNSATIPSTLILLKLALYISVDRKVAHPLPLVRFYCSKLVSKLTMSKLDTPTQLNVISGLSQGLTACDADRRQVSAPSDEEIIAVRNQVVDACPLLFERLVESGLTDAESWQTCRLLLKACSQRQKTSAWTSPSHMVTWLRKIQNIADQQAKQTRFESVQEVQSLIRSLLPITKAPISQPPPNTNLQGKPHSRIDGPINLAKRKLERPPSPPARPVSAGPTFGLPPRPRTEFDIHRSESPRLHQASSSSGPGTTFPSNRFDDPPRVRKRTRTEEGNGEGLPTLLSRMSSSASNGTAGRPNMGLSVKGSATASSKAPVMRGRVPSPEPNKDPVGGYSIKGAAKAAYRDEPPPPAPSTLLQRLTSSDTLAERIDGSDGNRRKKRKGKP